LRKGKNIKEGSGKKEEVRKVGHNHVEIKEGWGAGQNSVRGPEKERIRKSQDTLRIKSFKRCWGEVLEKR